MEHDTLEGLHLVAVLTEVKKRMGHAGDRHDADFDGYWKIGWASLKLG